MLLKNSLLNNAPTAKTIISPASVSVKCVVPAYTPIPKAKNDQNKDTIDEKYFKTR